jgi:hypothetical protein
MDPVSSRTPDDFPLAGEPWANTAENRIRKSVLYGRSTMKGYFYEGM